MPLRLFGGQGSGRVRTCPACEREIAAQATFCPSCYMVIRPEGATDLREHLRGGRIPGDVYLLRKMQVEDPNTGPVVRESPAALPPPPPAGTPEASPPVAPPVAKPAGTHAPAPVGASAPSAPDPAPAAPAPGTGTAGSLRAETDIASGARAWMWAHSILRFEPPFPPPTRSADGAPALLAWMLERDPVIPNNLELLEAIHAGISRDGPAARLGYQRHLLIQIADDLLLHPTRETLDNHLALLAAAYRRAVGAHHAAAHKGEDERNATLWQMASMASRLRVEGWVFRTRYGAPPDSIPPRRSRVSSASPD